MVEEFCVHKVSLELARSILKIVKILWTEREEIFDIHGVIWNVFIISI